MYIRGCDIANILVWESRLREVHTRQQMLPRVCIRLEIDEASRSSWKAAPKTVIVWYAKFRQPYICKEFAEYIQLRLYVYSEFGCRVGRDT